MRVIAAVVTLIVGVAVSAALAHAYAPHVGDRAADFYGRDIVGGGVVHLEDYLGRWVLVMFGMHG